LKVVYYHAAEIELLWIKLRKPKAVQSLNFR